VAPFPITITDQLAMIVQQAIASSQCATDLAHEEIIPDAAWTRQSGHAVMRPDTMSVVPGLEKSLVLSESERSWTARHDGRRSSARRGSACQCFKYVPTNGGDVRNWKPLIVVHNKPYDVRGSYKDYKDSEVSKDFGAAVQVPVDFAVIKTAAPYIASSLEPPSQESAVQTEARRPPVPTEPIGASSRKLSSPTDPEVLGPQADRWVPSRGEQVVAAAPFSSTTQAELQTDRLDAAPEQNWNNAFVHGS